MKNLIRLLVFSIATAICAAAPTTQIGVAAGTSLSLSAGVTTGSGGSVAGSLELGQGTAPTAGTTSIKLYAPSSVTSYIRALPGTAATGFYFGTNAAGVVTDSQVSTIPVANGGTGLTAGTSGGIPYFSSSSAISSSAALAANALVIGGGAGVAPATTTTGAGVLTALGIAPNATGGVVTAGGAPRILTITSSATPTINTDSYDCVTITAQAAAITSMTTNRTGTINNFQQLEIRIKDDGTARAITWGADFSSGIATLPTTTILGKTLVVYLEGDTVTGDFMCMSTGSYP